MFIKAKISFITLGCKLNYAETSTYERGFVAGGMEVVPWTEKADVCLVNTCTVTEHSDKKCRNIIRKLHRMYPEAVIVVTGCYAQLKRSEIEAIDGVKFVFGANEKSLVVPTVLNWLNCHSEPLPRHSEDSPRHSEGSTKCDEESQIFPAYSSGERTRSFLKVQDGCDYKCNYCTVPYARGESRSIPLGEVVAQAEEIASKGIREIVLTGVNIGDYGKGLKENFFDLIRALNDVQGIERYRISSIEPNLLTEEIIDWIASGTKFLPHFHIPLQSGSDTVLKEMGRRYDTTAFENKINYIRSKMGSNVFFGIDVIAGFPGETDELFMETCNFLKDKIRPAFIHIFPYSRRAGTPAAARKDQVQDSIKTERVEMLEALCSRLHEDFIEANRGTREKVLFESSDKNGKMFGYTGNYIRVERPFDPALIGKIVEVTI